MSDLKPAPVDRPVNSSVSSPPQTERDRIFNTPKTLVGDFRFGKQVAAVFDDMVDRSVPFYAEMQRMITELAADFAPEGSTVYDLGCSTGTTLIALDRVLPPGVNLVGIDNSQEMLDRCRAKLEASGSKRQIKLVCEDLHQPLELTDASVVVLMLTLQFVRPLYREQLVRNVYQGLADNGCLLLVEKVLGDETTFNRLFIKYYYEMKKRHGYSEMEIAQKREALENVLVPYRLEENRQLLARSGFRASEIFFKWHNFAGLAGLK
jgi:tRNA (cmo5U34)-methyltransferase